MREETRLEPPPPRRLHAPWIDRGHDLSRVLALSDGIFAFAMTLLVLNLVLPSTVGVAPSTLPGAVWGLRYAFYAYLLSFFVIFFYWIGHQLVFEFIRSYDRALLQLNVLFLLCIAVNPFATEVLAVGTNAASVSVRDFAVTLYAVAQLAAGASLFAVWKYARGRKEHVPAATPASWDRYVSLRLAITPLVFAISIPIAWLVNPEVAQYSWALIFILHIAVRRRAGGPEGGPGG
jgi:uncharacterized membrane protein